jgi:colanic acid biosynthesis glycosyl transferase WcaI
MRVLLLTQHYAPEVTAGRFRVEAFADALARRGHEVDVVCPVPNHPSGVVAEGFRGRLRVRDQVGQADVTYLWVATSRHKTPRTRLAYYGSYAAFATASGMVRPRPDLVVASSPPLSVAAVGALVATRHRVPLLLDIRDLWPYTPIAVGELAPGRVTAMLERLERWVYAKASAVVTANDAFAGYIADRAPTGREVVAIPNGTTQAWLDAGAADVERDAVGLPPSGFIWAYAGNIGLAHGVEHALEAQRLLGDDYRLLVIGEGPRRDDVLREAETLPGQVDVRPLMPPGEAARHLRAADAVLVSERQELVVSAKLYDACAIGRPIVAACTGELRRLIETDDLGLAVPHGDPGALAAAIRELRADPGLGERLVTSARAFAGRHLRERQAERFAMLGESVARSSQPARRGD